MGERRKVRDKVHHITQEQYAAAGAYYLKYGFVLTVDLQTTCGLPGYRVHEDWKHVDCKRCLRPKRKASDKP